MVLDSTWSPQQVMFRIPHVLIQYSYLLYHHTVVLVAAMPSTAAAPYHRGD
jgi:hypothetical protein